MIMHLFECGPLAITAGYCGLIGVHKRSMRHVKLYAYLKAVQLGLVVILICLICYQTNFNYRIMPLGSLFFELCYWIYSWYMIYSLSQLMDTDIDFGQSRAFVSLPPQVLENPLITVQYATPLLQGESPVIPIEMHTRV